MRTLITILLFPLFSYSQLTFNAQAGVSNNLMVTAVMGVSYNTQPAVFSVDWINYNATYNVAAVSAGVALLDGRIYLQVGGYAHLYTEPEYGYNKKKILPGASIKFLDRKEGVGIFSARFDGRQYAATVGFKIEKQTDALNQTEVLRTLGGCALMFTAGLFDYSRDIAYIDYNAFAKVFPNLNPQFFNPKLSWRNKYNEKDVNKGRNGKPLAATDAFHGFNLASAQMRAGALMLAWPIEAEFNRKNIRIMLVKAALYFASDRCARGVGEIIYNR